MYAITPILSWIYPSYHNFTNHYILIVILYILNLPTLLILIYHHYPFMYIIIVYIYHMICLLLFTSMVPLC